MFRAGSDTEENRGGCNGGASVRGLHPFAKDAKGWGQPAVVEEPWTSVNECYGLWVLKKSFIALALLRCGVRTGGFLSDF